MKATVLYVSLGLGALLAATAAADNPRLHLDHLNLDVALPASEGWSTRSDTSVGKDVDVLTRSFPGESVYVPGGNLDLELQYRPFDDCANWQQIYEKVIAEREKLRMKLAAAPSWLPGEWHRSVIDHSGGAIIETCRPVMGGVLQIAIKNIELVGDDKASVTRALAAIGDQVDQLNSNIMAKPVSLETLGVSFQGPKGSLWKAQKFPMGGDMVIRVAPEQPGIMMLLTLNAGAPLKCGPTIDSAGAQGLALEPGERFLPPSWYQKVARDPKGGISGCMDTGRGLFGAQIVVKGEAAEADLASARAVLESVTAALTGTK